MQTPRARSVEVRPAPIVILCSLGTFCVVSDGGVQDPVAKDRRACRTRAYRDGSRIVQVLISWTGVLQRSGPRVAATHINAESLAVAESYSFHRMVCAVGELCTLLLVPGSGCSHRQRMVNAAP